MSSPPTPKPASRRPILSALASTASISSLLSPRSPTGAAESTTALLDNDGRGRQPQSVYGSLPSPATSSLQIPNHPKTMTRSRLRKRVKYYIPGFAWIPNYSFSLLGGDILAGVTVASMLIPQSVSYASSLAKLSPLAGLFSASIPALVYALLGTSRQLNVAPEAALSLLVGQAINDLRHDHYHGVDPHSPEGVVLDLGAATAITLQVGLISFILGFFRLGFIDVVLSRALLRGFVAAVAVVIMIEQLIPMFGLTKLEHEAHPLTTLDKVLFLIRNIENLNWATTAISFTALAVLIIMRYGKRAFQGRKRLWWIYRIPEVFVVVVLSTILSSYLKWDKHGVDILGSVPINTGKHFFQLPIRSNNARFLKKTTSTAGLISVVGFLDSIVAAKQSGARFGYSISPNRELVALGAANLFVSLIPGTLPAFGSITRTRINGDVGGRTQMASLVCSGLVLLATFFLLPWLYYLPKCVLASIICLVVLTLLGETPHEVKYYWKMSAYTDLVLFSLTFVLSMIWNVEVGVITSLIISLLLVVHRSSKTRMTILGRVPGTTDRWKPIQEDGRDGEEDGVLIVRIRDNLDFANTAQLKERLRRLELYGPDHSHPSEDPSRGETSVLVFHMADVDSCDASAVEIFYELCEEYKNRGVGLYITHLRSGTREKFMKAGIWELLGPQAFFDNVGDAMASLRASGGMGHRR